MVRQLFGCGHVMECGRTCTEPADHLEESPSDGRPWRAHGHDGPPCRVKLEHEHDVETGNRGEKIDHDVKQVCDWHQLSPEAHAAVLGLVVFFFNEGRFQSWDETDRAEAPDAARLLRRAVGVISDVERTRVEAAAVLNDYARLRSAL